tara:strand:- start:21721 stop:22476 length:756 start_codon:yes stop_codon:yes gene_type:complete
MEYSIYLYIILSVLCLLIGFLGGFLGIALGAIRLPVIIIFGIEPIIAASTNLLAVIFGSLAGLLPAIKQGRVPIKSSLVISVPSMIAAFLGGYFAFQIPELYLIIIMIFCLIISGLVMTFYKISENEKRDETKGSVREFFVGILISYFGGTVGLALGVLRVPAFVYFLRMNIKTAGGINLLVSVLVGISAYLGHSFSGDLDYYLIISIVLPTILGMYLGSRFVKIVDDNQLRKVLGITLLILSAILLVREI